MLHLHGAGNGWNPGLHTCWANTLPKQATPPPHSCPELFNLENLYIQFFFLFKKEKREEREEKCSWVLKVFPISPSEVSIFFLFVSALILSPPTVTVLLRSCSRWPCIAVCSPGGIFQQQSILVSECHELVKFFLLSAEAHVLNKHGTVCKKAAVVHDWVT